MSAATNTARAVGVEYDRGAQIQGATLAVFHPLVYADPIGSAWRFADEWRRCAVNIYALKQTEKFLLGLPTIDKAEVRLREPLLMRTRAALAGELQALANIRPEAHRA